MNLSRTVSYGLHAAIMLGHTYQQSPMPSSRLAKIGRLPDRFLLQILRDLVANGILISTRGLVGGYVLARPPEKITVLDIVEALQGRNDWTLPATDEFPKDARRQLDSLFREVQASVREQLDSVTLADLLPSRSHSRS